jgi:DNA-3-methyladenine glycosylase II
VSGILRYRDLRDAAKVEIPGGANDRVGEVTSGIEVIGSTFVIKPRGPLSWKQSTDFLNNWPAIDNPAQRFVRMAFPLDGTLSPVAVALHEQDGVLHGDVAGTNDVMAVARQVARIFSLDHDATTYPEVGKGDPRIGKVMAALDGLRPVCFTSPYESAAWAVMSQRITQRQASAIKKRLIERHGQVVTVAGEAVGCFPTPHALLNVKSVQGLSAEKVERLHGVASAALRGQLDADRLRALGDEAAPADLRTIPGIGEFWSSGIYLRACGIADVFPNEPLAIAAAAKVAGLATPFDYLQVQKMAERWRPWRMWVCVLLRVAISRGVIENVKVARSRGR